MKIRILGIVFMAFALLAGCAEVEESGATSSTTKTSYNKGTYQIGDLVAEGEKSKYYFAGTIKETVVLNRIENEGTKYVFASNIFLSSYTEGTRLKDVGVTIDVIDSSRVKNVAVMKIKKD